MSGKPPTFSLQFKGTEQQVEDALRSKGPRVVYAAIQLLNRESIGLQTYIIANKLSGQVLHHRTGKLQSSVRVLPVVSDGSTLVAGVEAGGGPAWYGRLHEFGGTFEAQRYSIARFGLGITRKGNIGRKIRALEQRTMATNYTIHFPERSFVRSSVEELRAAIQERMRSVMTKVIETA